MIRRLNVLHKKSLSTSASSGFHFIISSGVRSVILEVVVKLSGGKMGSVIFGVCFWIEVLCWLQFLRPLRRLCRGSLYPP